eukprot:3172984-Pyramimonas_sp.AAC.1
MGALPDQMTDKGCDSFSADLAADGGRAIPDQAIRDLGRELSAGGSARERIETLAWAGAPEIQTDTVACASLLANFDEHICKMCASALQIGET